MTNMICPTAETLAQFLSGSAAPADAAEVEAHLGVCLDCRAALDDLSDNRDLRRWLPRAMKLAECADDAQLDHVISDLATARSGIETDFGRWEVAWEPGAVLDQYRIQEVIGRGGMGVVLKANDLALGARWPSRCCARGSRSQGPHRLIQEARIVAKLRHDNVVTVYAVVNAQGSPVPGHGTCGWHDAGRFDSLARSARARPGCRHRGSGRAGIRGGAGAGPDSPRRQAEQRPLGRGPRSCQDQRLRPGARRRYGCQRDPGRPLGRHTDLHEPGTSARRGTARLALGHLRPGRDTLRDLDRRSTFSGRTHMVFQQVTGEEPKPPRAWNDRVPRDLETICLKAMAKEPSRRYQTAAEMADDLALAARRADYGAAGR